MRHCMQKNIEASDFIFLIGTPRLKERIAQQDTNAAFEFNHILAKVQKNPNAFLPLLYQGEFNTAFPDILTGVLIRDFRDLARYPHLMVGLIHPLGIFPSLYPTLMGDKEYKALLVGFVAKLQNIQKDFEIAQLELNHEANDVPSPILKFSTNTFSNQNSPRNTSEKISKNLKM